LDTADVASWGLDIAGVHEEVGASRAAMPASDTADVPQQVGASPAPQQDEDINIENAAEAEAQQKHVFQSLGPSQHDEASKEKACGHNGMEVQQHESTLERKVDKQADAMASEEEAVGPSQISSGIAVQHHESAQGELKKQEERTASKEEAVGPSQSASGIGAEQHESTLEGEVKKQEETMPSKEEADDPNQSASGMEAQQQTGKKHEDTKATSSLSYIHLLAVDAGGGHNPQVFRMRQDQTMRRLASSYASFRQLRVKDIACLRMSAAGQESVDPLATVSGLALADGDIVTFSLEQHAQEQMGTSPVGCAKGAGKGRGRRQRQQPNAEEPAPKRPKHDGSLQEQPRKPLSSYMLWINENRGAIAAEIGAAQAPLVSKAAGERWRSLSEAERAPFDQQAAKAKADYDEAVAAFVAQGGTLMKRKRTGNELDNSQQVRRREPMPKKPWGGAFGVFLNEKRGEFKQALPMDCRPQDVVRAVGEAWRCLPQEEKQGYEDINARNMQDYKQAMEDYKQKYCADPEIPPTPPGLLRSAAVTSGPAKGWKIQCWRTYRGSLKWCIIEPGKTSRRLSNFKDLKVAVERDVYHQLHGSVRPGLLRRMNERVTYVREEGHVETPAKRRTPATSRTHETPLKAARLSGPPKHQTTKRFTGATPRQALKRAEADMDWSTLATQACRPPAEVGKGFSWTCNCQAHLVRHPRCVSSNGRLQPATIHLKDHVQVGRSEACDVVLGSTLTPQMLSRNHAEVRREGASFVIMDQGSVNGVLVNGNSVHGRCALNAGDIVTFGVATDAPEFDYVFEPCPRA